MVDFILPHIDPRFKRENLYPSFRLRNGNIRRDFLSQRFVDTVFGTRFKAATRHSGQPLTTLAYRACGTTSIAWLIAAMNGSLNGLDLDTGDLLRVPDEQSYLTQRQQASRIGTSVVI